MDQDGLVTRGGDSNLALGALRAVVVLTARVSTISLSLLVGVSAKTTSSAGDGGRAEGTSWALVRQHLGLGGALDWTVVAQWTSRASGLPSLCVVALVTWHWVSVRLRARVTSWTHVTVQGVHRVVVVVAGSALNWSRHRQVSAIVTHTASRALVNIGQTSVGAVGSLWAWVLGGGSSSEWAVVASRAGSPLA